MKNQTPCSDYFETSGIIFFARMLDKIRLNALGLLPDGYNLGFSDPTSFDARFCRFWEIDYDQLAARPWKAGRTRNYWNGASKAEKARVRSKSWFGILSSSSEVGATMALPV